jgi:hypothetical protein
VTSLITADFRFLHLAKTGGIWAAHAMSAAGIVPRADVEIPFHADLADTAAYDDLFTIAFVRQPLSWWRSYWAHRMETGWVAEHSIDCFAASDRFDEFMRAVIDRAPGFAGALFERFVGPPSRPIQFVGYYEQLLSDLERALRYAGARFDAQALRADPPLNRSDYVSYPAFYSRALAQDVARAERAAIERFYPWQAIPEELIARRRVRHTAPVEAGRRDPVEQQALLARDAIALEHAVRRLEQRLAETEKALLLLRTSKLLRHTRRIRIAYYRLRDLAGPSPDPSLHGAPAPTPDTTLAATPTGASVIARRADPVPARSLRLRRARRR